jgi:hypothetical protein
MLIQGLLDDQRTFLDEPALELRYIKGAKESASRSSEKETWDLKPPPPGFRQHVKGLLTGSKTQQRRSLDLVACFATETAVDNNGNTKPTALHFTSGNQTFLSMVDKLRHGVTQEDLVEALYGPWTYQRPLPVLNWDATDTRDYALRASDPSKEKLGVPGADWLAFRGLRFFRVAPIKEDIHTTGCFGSWKQGRFCWCLWTVPLERETVQTLVQLADLADLEEKNRRARGIGVVFQSQIGRSDQGGYGSFSPASVV